MVSQTVMTNLLCLLNRKQQIMHNIIRKWIDETKEQVKVTFGQLFLQKHQCLQSSGSLTGVQLMPLTHIPINSQQLQTAGNYFSTASSHNTTYLVSTCYHLYHYIFLVMFPITRFDPFHGSTVPRTIHPLSSDPSFLFNHSLLLQTTSLHNPTTETTSLLLYVKLVMMLYGL